MEKGQVPKYQVLHYTSKPHWPEPTEIKLVWKLVSLEHDSIEYRLNICF